MQKTRVQKSHATVPLTKSSTTWTEQANFPRDHGKSSARALPYRSWKCSVRGFFLQSKGPFLQIMEIFSERILPPEIIHKSRARALFLRDYRQNQIKGPNPRDHKHDQCECPALGDHRSEQSKGPSPWDHRQDQSEGPSPTDHRQGQIEGPMEMFVYSSWEQWKDVDSVIIGC